MKQFFGRKSRSALGLVLLVSLGFHVVAIVIFGTIKFVSEVLREETVFEAAPIVQPPQEKPEYTVNVQQRNQATPPPRPPAIVVNNPSELDIPALDIDVNVDSSSVYGRGGGGFGGGLAGIREMAVTANLFGMQITSSGLGVALDISGSAHPHLDKAIAEIDKNFPTAHMILVVGCGMTETDGTGRADSPPGKPRIVRYNSRGSNEKYDSLERSAGAQLEKFFKTIGDKKRSEKLRRYFKRRDNLYLLYGGDIFAANYAFENLIKQNVDVIYWFADFADRIDKPVIENLTRRLKQKGIKVIAHNFMGKPVRPEVQEMTDITGGKSIALIPGSQKK